MLAQNLVEYGLLDAIASGIAKLTAGVQELVGPDPQWIFIIGGAVIAWLLFSRMFRRR